MKPYLKYTFGLVWRQKRRFIWLVLLILADTAARLVQPYIYKVLVDTLTNGIVAGSFASNAVSLLVELIVLWFFLAVINNLMSAQNHFLVWAIGGDASQLVHLDGYRRLLRLDYGKHTQKHSSQYAKIVDEADNSMWQMTNWWLGRFFPSFIGFVGMLGIAFSVSWQMTLLSLSVIPFGLAIIIFMIKKNEDEQRRVNKLWNLKHEHMSDQISNIITYKLNEDERLFVDVQKKYSDRAVDSQRALNAKWRVTEMLNPDAVARFMVMALGVFLVKDGAITLGTLFMFMGLLNEILIPLHLLSDILPEYSRRARHIEKLLNLLDTQDTVVDPKRAKKIPAVVNGEIEFRNVSFTYKEDDEKSFGIRDVSFTIRPGEHIALVGHSGAGKSTIMALLTRLADPTKGAILLDSVDIRKYRQAEYRRLVGTVLQEHSLYNETVAANIAYGHQHATRDEIIEAAKKAAAHEFILRLPKGYDTLIGERGVRLSGGEKQRLSTVRNADKILVLREGRVVQAGTHLELLRSSEEYREMVDLQTGGFLQEDEE